jgi:hypothetical protein
MSTLQDLIDKLNRNSHAKDFPYKYEIVKELPKRELKREYKNMLPYCGKPQYDVYEYKLFIEKVLDNAKYMYKENMKSLEEAIKLKDNVEIKDCKEDVDKIITLLPNINKIISDKYRDIYCIVDYPVEKSVIFKFKVAIPITIGKLLYINAHMYHEIYRIEDENIDNPPFGIWGHFIGDLCYNGHSSIKIFDKYIICKFECDS